MKFEIKKGHIVTFNGFYGGYIIEDSNKLTNFIQRPFEINLIYLLTSTVFRQPSIFEGIEINAKNESIITIQVILMGI